VDDSASSSPAFNSRRCLSVAARGRVSTSLPAQVHRSRGRRKKLESRGRLGSGGGWEEGGAGKRGGCLFQHRCSATFPGTQCAPDSRTDVAAALLRGLEARREAHRPVNRVRHQSREPTATPHPTGPDPPGPGPRGTGPTRPTGRGNPDPPSVGKRRLAGLCAV